MGLETVEMLVCIKDWELGQQRAQHVVEDQELEDYFKNLWLNERKLLLVLVLMLVGCSAEFE